MNLTEASPLIALVVFFFLIGGLGIYWGVQGKRKELENQYGDQGLTRTVAREELTRGKLSDIDFDAEDEEEEEPVPEPEEPAYKGYSLEPEGGFWIKDELWYLMYEGGVPVPLEEDPVVDPLSPIGFASADAALKAADESLDKMEKFGADVANIPEFLGPTEGWKEAYHIGVYNGKDLRRYWEYQEKEAGPASGYTKLVQVDFSFTNIRRMVDEVMESPPEFRKFVLMRNIMNMKKNKAL